MAPVPAGRGSPVHGDAQLGALIPEEFIADTIARLRIELVERAVLRSLEVIRSRGQEFRMGRHSFRIVDGQGIEVYLDEGASGHR